MSKFRVRLLAAGVGVVVLLSIIVVLLSAFSSSALDHGTVTAKKYDPTWINYYQICSAYQMTYEDEEEDINGTVEMEEMPIQGPCISYVNYQAVEPDCWELDLQSGSQTGSQCVAEADYNRYQVGQVYP